MGEVIDIGAWRKARSGAPAGQASAGNVAPPAPADGELETLERAVQRLHPLVSEAAGQGRQLEGKVETELLAIMGELTVGLVGEAARRAERLADRLAATGGRSGR